MVLGSLIAHPLFFHLFKICVYISDFPVINNKLWYTMEMHIISYHFSVYIIPTLGQTLLFNFIYVNFEYYKGSILSVSMKL
jgi:hypothetical protein